MKHYDSFENIKYDGTLLGEEIWAFNKIDGQNFCAKFSPKRKEFTMFGSKTQNVDETNEQFAEAVRYFKTNYAEKITEIILRNSKKNCVFTGIDEITVFFEWHGKNTFSGVHVPGEPLKLSIIDVFLKKKGYIEPRPYYDMFDETDIDMAELVYQGKLTKEFITKVQTNDWTKPGCLYPYMKEGVVCKRSTLLKGQRMPKVKIKTNWWLETLKAAYPDRWKELE